ncbi:MAG: hypothetical protein H7A25_01130 [Leptospiraceae bacterium]|nr:hypothetical protein [Leptospiraceae bacterium]MCP5498478.1 hypothetical protein [Leptospiraceae bacterium]
MRTFLLLLIFFCYSILAEGIKYTGEDGTVFTNGRYGFTLQSLDENTGVQYTEYSLDKDTEYKPATGTIYISTAGPHNLFFRGIDKVENKEIFKHYHIIVDLEAPVLLTQLKGEKKQYKGRLFYSPSVSLYITAKDYGSGLEGIYMSINGGEYKKVTQDINEFKTSGDYTINYYAVDKVGNKSSEKKLLFSVQTDIIPPDSGIKLNRNKK